ncbi:MAG: anaerobic ribonucleoside-triphosphate reductase activating protein [Candidatus Parcubacteria bacterium]|nr:anaerobic ribonucleoside-triphosphate reductase activating protein [Candidatus Parcubacteria bacterium]
MLIGGLQRLSLIDYPGKICATVFTLGCNFRCQFCHNPELVDPEKIKKQPIIEEKKFFEFLESRKGDLDGVCITGGEPTLHKDLPEFIKKIKSLGFSVKLDTNGSNPEMLEKLLTPPYPPLSRGGVGGVDYIAMDIKDLEQFSNSNFQFSKSINLIKNSGIDYEFRMTVVPKLHKKEDIIEIAKKLSPAKKFYLQQFRPGKNLDKKFEKEKPYSKKDLLEFCEAIKSYFDYCGVRG